MKTIPIVGRRLHELLLYGNGKDCWLRIVVEDPRAVMVIPMRDPRVTLVIDGRLTLSSFNDGDRDLGICCEPGDDIWITAATLEFPGPEEDWHDAIKQFESGEADCIGWTIYRVDITLTRSS